MLYDYGCPNCGHEKEINHKMNDTTQHHCEKCDTIMKKIIRASAFNLRGAGWHSGGFSAKSNKPK